MSKHIWKHIKQLSDNLNKIDQVDEVFKEPLRELISPVSASVLNDLIKDACVMVAAVVVERIVTKIITTIVTKSAVSVSVLGGGAAGSGLTLGGSIAIAVIADFAITTAVDWWLDPVGNLEKEIRDELHKSYRKIVVGTAGNGGLRGTFQRIVHQRVQQQRQALVQFFATQQ